MGQYDYAPIPTINNIAAYLRDNMSFTATRWDDNYGVVVTFREVAVNSFNRVLLVLPQTHLAQGGFDVVLVSCSMAADVGK